MSKVWREHYENLVAISDVLTDAGADPETVSEFIDAIADEMSAEAIARVAEGLLK